VGLSIPQTFNIFIECAKKFKSFKEKKSRALKSNDACSGKPLYITYVRLEGKGAFACV
jgi:hypothetical protein